MQETIRGISPEILFTHLENTMPFLFADRSPLTPYTETILRFFDESKKTPLKLSHFDYFSLCLCAHYSSVATFVPTDVDNQIRKHLWDQPLEKGTTEKMAELLLNSYDWDYRPVTTRFQEGDNYYISGHQGEWFSVAVGAYAIHAYTIHGEKNLPLAEEVKQKIIKELHRESDVFRFLKKKKDGVGLLRACTLIAHNLGDLDRVIDQWELPAQDPLRLAVYKLGHEKHKSFGAAQEELLQAGDLNKAFMASENHRHYPLRKPKPLRKSIDFLLPVGPFFDAWGEKIARHPALSDEEVAEIALALLEGFERLSSPKIPLYGYARAIGGILRAFRGGPKNLLQNLPSKPGKTITSGLIAQINQPSPEVFHSQWNRKALQHMRLV